LQIDKVIQFWKKLVSWVIGIRGDKIALQTRLTRLKYSSAESAAEFGHGVLQKGLLNGSAYLLQLWRWLFDFDYELNRVRILRMHELLRLGQLGQSFSVKNRREKMFGRFGWVWKRLMELRYLTNYDTPQE